MRASFGEKPDPGSTMPVLSSVYSIKESQSRFESCGGAVCMDHFVPADSGRSFPAVIGLHGWSGGHASMAEPAAALAAEGFAVYVLHYFDRSGPVEAHKGALVRHFPGWMRVLWDAVSHVERQGAVDSARIGLLGFSLGAYLALCNSAIDCRIRAVVECFGGFPREMKLFTRRLCPVLILHGEADSVIPVEEAYHLQAMMRSKGIPHAMQIYAGVGHGFEGETRRDASARTLAFFNRYLKGESPTG